MPFSTGTSVTSRDTAPRPDCHEFDHSLRETATNCEEDDLLRRIRKRLGRGGCEHQHTLVVTSVGIRRRVCDDCGHISFSIVPHSKTTARAKDATALRKAAGL